MDPSKENISVSTVDSIDEYQLLCTNEGKLVLWDLSAKGNTKPVEFELEQISVRCGSVMAKRALRGYELNDAQPFRVNPEEGIVVVMVEVYPATFVLVIPTKAFTRFKAKSRVKWEEWSKFATKFRLPLSAHWIHAFHTHILCFNIYYQDTSIFDFSLYCREVVRSKEPSMQANYVLKGNTVLACQPSSDLPRPLAVTFRGRFKPPAFAKGYPTENGVLFIEVRIPVVAKRRKF